MSVSSTYEKGGMLIVTPMGVIHGFWSHCVQDKTVLLLAVKVSLRGALEEITVQNVLISVFGLYFPRTLDSCVVTRTPFLKSGW